MRKVERISVLGTNCCNVTIARWDEGWGKEDIKQTPSQGGNTEQNVFFYLSYYIGRSHLVNRVYLVIDHICTVSGATQVPVGQLKGFRLKLNIVLFAT